MLAACSAFAFLACGASLLRTSSQAKRPCYETDGLRLWTQHRSRWQASHFGPDALTRTPRRGIQTITRLASVHLGVHKPANGGCSMRARGAATAAFVTALVVHRADAFSLVLNAANSSSFRFSFSGSRHASLRFELWPEAGGEAAATPLLCGVAVSVPGTEPATLTLTDLPESTAFKLTYAFVQGSGLASADGSLWVVLPEATLAASDTCWTCVFASLSLYSVAWSQVLRREGAVAPASRSDVSPLCSCWLCDGAGALCRVAPQDACDSARFQASPPVGAVDESLDVPSTSLPPPLLPVLPPPPSPPQPPEPPSPPLPPWFLEYWPQLAVPSPARPPPPSVSGMAGAAPADSTPPLAPWWLGSRGTSDSPPPPRLNTTGVPWWALLQEDLASPPPPGVAPTDVVAQNYNGSPPGPMGDTTQLQQAIEGWLSAVPALSAPAAGGTSAAAVLASVLADVVSRAEAKRPTAAVATALGLGGAAAASVWNLWTSPVVGPYLLELWAQAESAVWPGAQGAG